MKRLGAAFGLGFLLTAVPLFLVLLNGPPSVPSIDVDDFKQVLSGPLLSADAVLGALGFLSWVLWAYLVLVVVLRIAAIAVMRGQFDEDSFLVALTNRIAPSLLLKLVDVAVGGALLLAPLSPPNIMNLPTTAMVASVTSESRSNNRPPAAEFEAHNSYVVRPGDSLWKIAETELGSGQRWPEIFEINKDRVFPDGRVFRNARLIRPNWILWLPEYRPTPDESLERAPNIDPSPLDSHSGMGTYETGSQGRGSMRSGQAPVPDTSGHPPPEKATNENGGHSSLGDPVVELPSGVALAASFGAGILASQAIALLHRRRRFRPSEQLTEVPKEPEIVVDLRRTGLASRPAKLDSAGQELSAAWRQCAAGLPAILAVIERRSGITFLIDRPEELEVDLVSTSRVHFKTLDNCIQAEVVGPFIPRAECGSAFEEGLYIPLGLGPGGEAVHCSLLGHGPVEIGGASAGPLIINSILACVAGRSRHEVEVFLIGDPGRFGRCAELPHVRCASSWDQADETIREIQAETLGRARLFARKAASNLWDFLAMGSNEFVPALVVAATEPPTEYRAAMNSIASQAGELGIGFFAAGWRPEKTKLSLAADTLVEVHSELPITSPLRPSLLDDQAIAEVVAVIAASNPTEQDQVTVPNGQGEILDESGAPPDQVTEYLGKAHDNGDSGFSAINGLPTERFVPLDDQNRMDEVGLRSSASGNGAWSSRDRPMIDESTRQFELAPPATGKIEVRCLGMMSISRDGTQLLDGWVKRSKELLAYLVANREGVPKDRIIEVFWPETKLKNGEALLRDAIYHLRKHCLAEGDLKWSEDYVRRVGPNVMLGEGRWWTDIWEFESLISKASEVNSMETTDSLRKALTLYHGEFCDDGYYPWAEPLRERYRRLFIRASAKLAELREAAGDPEEAIEVLERGIEVDQFCEDLYRRLIRVESSEGRTNTAVMRYQRLVSLLSEELGLEPERQTRELLNEVTRQNSRPWADRV